MTVADLVYIDSTGYHYADYPTFLQFVQDQYRGIYGADVYLGPDSMDGQWTAILAQALYDTALTGSKTYNSFSPTTAQGVGLSRVVKINGLRRNVPTRSTAIVTITGTAGTVILNGIVADSLGQQWALPASVTIPPGGDIDVTATSTVDGAVQAEASTITVISTPTLGWQSVTNSSAATPGAPVEQDGELRLRQSVSQAIPAQTVIQATRAALANLSGVTEVRAYENVTDITDGNGLPPHSVCFIVQGGDVTDITNTIGLYKTPGTNTFATGPNSHAETYIDPAGLPVPINFYSPGIAATIGVQLTIKALTGWDSSFETPIAAAVAELVASFGIGGTVVYTQIFVSAYNAAPIPGTYYVQGVQIQKNGGGFAAANIILDFNEIPECDPNADIVFVIV
ncbi:MAG: hypothetical protein OEW15_11700 [Nitrospirota bacterium]|nr:hypothetical protein [Nitrospirota bacterium]